MTDLSLAIERLTAQIKTNRARNAHLIDTARFVSINDYLDINNCRF